MLHGDESATSSLLYLLDQRHAMQLVFTQPARGSQTVEFISLFLAEERATQALSFLLAR